LKVEYVSFNDRSARSHYIAERFEPYIAGKVLDVGCDRALLRTLRPDIDYFGVDMGGTPDLSLNLEEIAALPFEDGSFDTVVCSDVLEHLDNIHFMLSELVRVSRKHLIISLPNNWTNARRPLERGKGSFDKYGLPLEKPVDRHKWFFSLSEAIAFMDYQAQKLGVNIVEQVVTEKPRPLITRAARRIIYPQQEHYLNRYSHTYWTVLRKG